MGRGDDIDVLIEAVEAGVISTDLIQNALDEMWAHVTCLAAFDGSVEAADELKRCLLPDWTLTRYGPRSVIEGVTWVFAETAEIASRGALLVILRAYRTECAS